MMPCQKARSNGIKIEIRKKAKAAGRVCLVAGLFSDLLGSPTEFYWAWAVVILLIEMTRTSLDGRTAPAQPGCPTKQKNRGGSKPVTCFGS